MNNLIVTNSIEEYGEENITSNQVIYYRDDDTVKFRANVSDDPFAVAELITISNNGGKSNMEQIRLETEGSTITRDGVVQTFEDILSLVMDNEKIVYIVESDTIRYTPSAFDGNAIWFDTTVIEGGEAVIMRCIINNNNEVKIDQVEVQEKLIEGYNLKTINGNSILGKGNIVINQLPTTTTTVVEGTNNYNNF